MPSTKPSKGKVLEKISAPVLKRRKISLKTIGRYKEQVLAAYAPYLVPEAMEKLREKLKDGSSRELNTVLKIFGVIGATGNGIVINNINSANSNASAAASSSSGGKSFDSIARRLHEARSAKMATIEATATPAE